MTGPATTSAALAAFNAAPADDAERDVARCCASRALASAIASGRPYPDMDALSGAIDAAFARLGWADITEALAGHPRIGDRVTGWPAGEQAGAAAAPPDVARGLADGNHAYEQRFGHVFLICASGLSAAEMLARLHARLGNDPRAERRVVADELRKITQLRMRKLLGPSREAPSDARAAGGEASQEAPSDARAAGGEASQEAPSDARAAGGEASREAP
jgi:2-oxo-4-hydroxy-4-carboxy-5-ureidoimidazoline decarboxylase